jgi:hypothetical protein
MTLGPRPAYARGAVLLLGGLIYVAVFHLRYSTLEPDLYQFRDDGVVTMSVGRHIVDHGFVGVSPSGPIVEASSSPLQTIVYAIAYAISGVGYADYSWLQTYATTFGIGVVFTAFFLPATGGALVVAAIRHLASASCIPSFSGTPRAWRTRSHISST